VRQIAILIFPGVQSLDVAGPLDVFAEANRFLPPADQYRLTVLGTETGLIPSSNGLLLAAHCLYSQANGGFDLLLVPGGPSLPDRPYDPNLSNWLAAAAQASVRHGSVCNGAFLLGSAGLLEGRKVTTHWNDAALLANRFPGTTVDADRLYLRDGKLYSSAGVTAGIDLSLFLISEDFGPDLALKVAKRLVVFTQRSGGQSQFSPYLAPLSSETSPLTQVQDYVRGHLDRDMSIPRLAAVAGMSERNFARVFAAEMQITPGEFIERARLDVARSMLEATDDPLKVIAYRCGFGSVTRMRQAFVRRLGLTAQQYRQNFGVVGIS